MATLLAVAVDRPEQAKVTVTVSVVKHQLVKVGSTLPVSLTSVAAFSG